MGGLLVDDGRPSKDLRDRFDTPRQRRSRAVNLLVDHLEPEAWRQAGDQMWACAKSRAAYLDFLAGVFGYQLSEVKQVVAGAITAESIDLDSYVLSG